MLVTLLPIGTLAWLVQPENAPVPKPVALAGIVTLVRVLQNQKARWTLELLLC